MTTAVVIPGRVLERIFERVDVGGPDDCWVWLLSLNRYGYGQVGWSDGGKTRMTAAHRVAWVAVNGPIPDDLTVDHLCRQRSCCNPRHMRLLTRSANASNNAQAIRTRCRRNHEYTPETTLVTRQGHRRCRTCDNDLQRLRYQRRAA